MVSRRPLLIVVALIFPFLTRSKSRSARSLSVPHMRESWTATTIGTSRCPRIRRFPRRRTTKVSRTSTLRRWRKILSQSTIATQVGVLSANYGNFVPSCTAKLSSIPLTIVFVLSEGANETPASGNSRKTS